MYCYYTNTFVLFHPPVQTLIMSFQKATSTVGEDWGTLNPSADGEQTEATLALILRRQEAP